MIKIHKKPGRQGENPVTGFEGESLHIQRLWLIAEEIGCCSQINDSGQQPDSTC